MLSNDPQCYRTAVFYSVHVRAFRDANGDGMGDFRGPHGFLWFRLEGERP